MYHKFAIKNNSQHECTLNLLAHTKRARTPTLSAMTPQIPKRHRLARARSGRPDGVVLAVITRTQRQTTRAEMYTVL